MRELVNDILLAFSYFTRLPVAGWARFSEDALSRAAGWLPLVGWVTGGIGAAVLYLASMFLPRDAAILLALAAALVVTGAFHEDGLADTADGFGPVGDRDKALAAMKDSRLGSFGVLALGLTLALKFCALRASPDVAFAAGALIVAHALSRLPPICVIATHSYVTQATSRARLVAQRLPRGNWLPALAGALLPPILLVAPPRLLLIACCLAALSVAFTFACRQRFGGYTGDTLGALQQLGETTVLLALVAGPQVS
ncbi:MAG: adenosylcobinamide-GDP ribazoletransferase [Gammaproteobacteria bacterium]|nr:adenosylcobinamide-GDP ribazoletransferase [Gammaproteobacteria bacterium]